MLENPLLSSLRMPGETFTLPSGALLYKDDEIDESVKNGEMHVFPMTAYDEIVIKTPDLLFSGEAAKIVITRCVPSVKKPERLFAKDVDFLMLCLRKVSYGPDIEINYKHSCNEAKSHSYVITVDSIIKKTKRLVPTTLEKQLSVTLSNGQILEIEPLRFDGYIKMSQVTNIMDKEDTPNPEIIFNKVVDALATIIVSVDTIKDPTLLREWLSKVPIEYHYIIQKAATDILDWGVDSKCTLKCKDCGEKITYNPLLNPISFFSMR